MAKLQVKLYDLPDGTYPAQEFIDSLDPKMRAKVGSDISRVLYFFFDGGKAILTHGFIKKTQKTPPSEIERAIRYRKEYFSRKEQDR